MIRKALALVVGVASAVNPVPAPAAATSWIPATCATGSIDPVAVDQGHYLLTTHMTICSPYYTPLRYALVLFRPDTTGAGASPDKLGVYAATGPSDRMADVELGRPVPQFGLCLMRDLRTRTACARVDIAPDGTATSTTIAPDDPLVTRTVVWSNEVLPKPPDNYCGTCVGFR